MAGLVRGQEVVHEVDVAHQGGVPERRVDRVGLPAADQHTRAASPEVGDLLAAGLNRASAQGGDAAAQRVQNVDQQELSPASRELVEGGTGGIPGQGLHVRPRRGAC
jgi:hypothetical protein